jgi:hypothetical protein
LVVCGLVVLIGLGVLCFVPPIESVYALSRRTVEFPFVVCDSETKEALPGAQVTVWDISFEPAPRKQLAEITTDARGIAVFVRDNQDVEDVTGISASRKLEGVRSHPAGIGTFNDRYWCALDVAAKGYVTLKNQGLGDYDDNGYDETAKMHRFEFVIEMRRE